MYGPSAQTMAEGNACAFLDVGIGETLLRLEDQRPGVVLDEEDGALGFEAETGTPQHEIQGLIQNFVDR